MTTALLILDMQNVFVPMTTTCLPHIKSLISHFQSRSLPTIFLQHGHSKAELTPPYKNQLVRKWGPADSIATGSEDWKLMPDIAQFTEGHTIIAKNTYDGFINTDLANILKDLDVQTVVVCGVMTDCCCDTTARSAFNRGYETWLVKDACGTENESQHEAGLRGFGYGFGEVLESKEVMERVT
jgi:nicotinamidase-related amidase